MGRVGHKYIHTSWHAINTRHVSGCSSNSTYTTQKGKSTLDRTTQSLVPRPRTTKMYQQGAVHKSPRTVSHMPEGPDFCFVDRLTDEETRLVLTAAAEGITPEKPSLYHRLALACKKWEGMTLPMRRACHGECLKELVVQRKHAADAFGCFVDVEMQRGRLIMTTRPTQKPAIRTYARTSASCTFKLIGISTRQTKEEHQVHTKYTLDTVTLVATFMPVLCGDKMTEESTSAELHSMHLDTGGECWESKIVRSKSGERFQIAHCWTWEEISTTQQSTLRAKGCTFPCELRARGVLRLGLRHYLDMLPDEYRPREIPVQREGVAIAVPVAWQRLYHVLPLAAAMVPTATELAELCALGAEEEHDAHDTVWKTTAIRDLMDTTYALGRSEFIPVQVHGP